MAHPLSPVTGLDVEMDDPPTVSPSALLTNSEYNTSDETDLDDFCFATLEFPDATYRINYLSTLIGRNMTAQKYIDENAGFWLDGKRLRRPGSQPGEGTPDRESEPPEIPDMESFEGDTLIGLRLSDVGGILGPQPERIGQTAAGDPEDVLYVHPPTSVEDGEVPKLTSISKQHLRVAFRKDHGWTLEVLGRNGAFHNDTYVSPGTEVELNDGDEITISGLSIVFDNSARPDVEQKVDKDDYLMESDVDSAISVARSKTLDGDTSDLEGASTDGNSEAEAEADGDNAEQPAARPSRNKKKPKRELSPKSPAKSKKPNGRKVSKSENTVASPEEQPNSEQPQKRRGPGRPPADGIMSKRERREREKAAKLGMNYGDILPTRPKGKPRPKSEGNDDAGSGDDLKQAKKRKRVAPEGDEGEEGENGTMKDAAEEHAPREPTPKESDYTEEQLVRPEGTYQPLLYTILSEAKTPLALPQIYEAFKNKWPYFRFRAKTTGWESSVRHNLTPNGVFKTNGKAGKGYLWTINPDVPFEPKVKRASVADPTLTHRSTYSGSGITPYQPRPFPIYGHPNGQTYPPGHVHHYPRPAYQPPPQQGQGLYSQNSAKIPASASPSQNPSQPYRHPHTVSGNSTQHQQAHSQYTQRPPAASTPQSSATNQSAASGSKLTYPLGKSPQPQSQSRFQPSPQLYQPTARPVSAVEQLKRGETPILFQKFKEQLLGMYTVESEKEALGQQVEKGIAFVREHLTSESAKDTLENPIKNIVNVLQGMLKEDARSQSQRPRPTGPGAHAGSIQGSSAGPNGRAAAASASPAAASSSAKGQSSIQEHGPQPQAASSRPASASATNTPDAASTPAAREASSVDSGA